MQEANMERNELLNGHFTYKTLADGAIERSHVICSHCHKVFSYHRSASSLRYHMSAKHTGVDISTEPKQTLRQSTLDATCGRPIDHARSQRLTNTIARWIALDCRPIYVFFIFTFLVLAQVRTVLTRQKKYLPFSGCTYCYTLC